MAVRGMVPNDMLRRRMERAFWLILLCYLALVGRLLYLQGVQGPILHQEAIQRREERIPLPARRGAICDRNGRPLAVSLSVGVVGFDPSQVQPNPDDAKATAKTEQALTATLPRVAALLHLPEADLADLVKRARARSKPEAPVKWVVVKRDVPYDLAQQIRDTHPKLIGFGVQDASKRVYSSAQSAAQVVGFLGAGGSGAAGLERACGRWLDGHDGYAEAELDDRKREIPGTLQRLIPAKDGLDIHTTLDANAQHIVTEEAGRIVEKYHPKGVSIVVVEPDTGDILALVSSPNYDPNPGRRNSLTGEALAERCAARLYEPGSTLKALTIAGALNDGAINRGSGFYCNGHLQIGKKIIHCVLHGAAERNGHGYEMPEDILRHSCNVGAAQVGLRLGPQHLYAIDRRFGLFDKLDFGLPGTQRGRLSFDPNEQIYTPAKAARVAFGHSITTTPLHVALAYAAIANGGLLMRPRLVTSVTDATGATRQAWAPQTARRVLSAQTSAQVCGMLRAVVANGTAKVTAIPGYQIAGKTGTANKYRHGAYVGSFVGFLPASPQVRPRAVVLVAVDEPQGAYFGAEVAAPAFREIARRLMTYWHVPEDDPTGNQARIAEENLRRAGQAPVRAARHTDAARRADLD